MRDELRQQGQFDERAEKPSPSSRSARATWALRAFGVAAAILVWLALGGAEGVSEDARRVAAIATLMAIWWTTEAIPLAVTSLLPIVLIPMLTEASVAQATAPYANPIVFLFLGGFLIAIAMEKWDLHRRIALLTLRRVGAKPKQIVLGMMLATGFLSMWVSNTATTLMMLPIGLSVVALMTSGPGAAAEGRKPHQPGHVDPVPDENINRFATLPDARHCMVGEHGRSRHPAG